MGAIKKYIVAGLLVWLPLAVTVFIVKLVVDLLDNIFLLLPAEYQPAIVLGFSIPGFGIIVAISIATVVTWWSLQVPGVLRVRALRSSILDRSIHARILE